MSAVYIHRYSTKPNGILTAIRQMSAVYTPLFDKVDVHSYMYIQRVLAYTFSRHVSPTNLRFSFGSCRFRCITRFAFGLLCCLRVNFACLLVCLPPKKKRPHAPGTHATRRNIAVAIPLAFNKRLQQHMRSTTLDPASTTNLSSLRFRGVKYARRNAIGIWKVRARPILLAPDLLTGIRHTS